MSGRSQLLFKCPTHRFIFMFSVSKAYSDLNLFQKKNDVNPLRGFLVPLVQVCSFSSVIVLLHLYIKDFFCFIQNTVYCDFY